MVLTIRYGLVAVFLFQFQLFPVLRHLSGGLCLYISEHVGMAEYQFFAEAVAYVLHVEVTGLATYLGVEGYVQQHVAQLLADVAFVVAHQGVAQFVGLFDGVGAQALVGLFAIPGAFLAELVEDVKEASEGFHLFLSGMYHVVQFVSKQWFWVQRYGFYVGIVFNPVVFCWREFRASVPRTRIPGFVCTSRSFHSEGSRKSANCKLCPKLLPFAFCCVP